MKAQSASVALYHFDSGRHKEVCMWHDQDHKPEVVGTVPNIFVSQRWVAPPDLMAVRPPSTLEHNGGEYVNLYWSTGTPEQITEGFRVLGERLVPAGRMELTRYILRTWGGRMRPVSAYARPGLELSIDAVTCAQQNTGLMVVIGELRDAHRREAYASWHESVHLPMILDTGLFTGAVKLMSNAKPHKDLFVVFYYTDRPDPRATYVEFQAIESEWTAARKDFPDGDQCYRRIHTGMYRPSIGHYEFYD